MKIKNISAAAKSLQSCPILCHPTDGSPPGSPVPGILQARILEWVAISFSSAWKWKVKVKLLSHVRLFTTPWTAAYQAPLPMGFSRQAYWSGLPLPSPKNISRHCQISWQPGGERDVKSLPLLLIKNTCSNLNHPAVLFPGCELPFRTQTAKAKCHYRRDKQQK